MMLTQAKRGDSVDDVHVDGLASSVSGAAVHVRIPRTNGMHGAVGVDRGNAGVVAIPGDVLGRSGWLDGRREPRGLPDHELGALHLQASGGLGDRDPTRGGMVAVLRGAGEDCRTLGTGCDARAAIGLVRAPVDDPGRVGLGDRLVRGSPGDVLEVGVCRLDRHADVHISVGAELRVVVEPDRSHGDSLVRRAGRLRSVVGEPTVERRAGLCVGNHRLDLLSGERERHVAAIRASPRVRAAQGPTVRLLVVVVDEVGRARGSIACGVGNVSPHDARVWMVGKGCPGIPLLVDAHVAPVYPCVADGARATCRVRGDIGVGGRVGKASFRHDADPRAAANGAAERQLRAIALEVGCALAGVSQVAVAHLLEGDRGAPVARRSVKEEGLADVAAKEGAVAACPGAAVAVRLPAVGDADCPVHASILDRAVGIEPLCDAGDCAGESQGIEDVGIGGRLQQTALVHEVVHLIMRVEIELVVGGDGVEGVGRLGVGAVGVKDATRVDGILIKEGGANAVKLEGGAEICSQIEAIVNASIPVVAHLGLTPQSVNAFGGFKVQGKSLEKAKKLIDDALKIQQAGACAVVLEGIPAKLADIITKKLVIPTIGIGAGNGCDGQVLVYQDMLGLTTGHTAKFVKRFAQLGNMMRKGINDYISETKNGEFPAQEHTYAIDDAVISKLTEENE